MAEILVTSLVSGSTKMPRIEILMEKPRIQISHLEAINLALNILQCVNLSSKWTTLKDGEAVRLTGTSLIITEEHLKALDRKIAELESEIAVLRAHVPPPSESH